jgi:hypothetical protein
MRSQASSSGASQSFKFDQTAKSNTTSRSERYRQSRVNRDDFDYGPLHQGIKLLKFGNRGNAHEKIIKLSGNRRYLSWKGKIMSPKFGKRCTVDLEKVIRIQSGQMTYKFERLGDSFGLAKEKSLSILYSSGDSEISLDLIAPTVSIYKYWYKGLKKILQKIQDDRDSYSPDELYLKLNWERADINNDGALSFSEIKKLLIELNINMSTNSVQQMFTLVDINNNNLLAFDEFCEFIKLLRERPELDYLWNMLIGGESLTSNIEPFPSMSNVLDSTKEVLTMEQFLKFWFDIQGEELQPHEAYTKFETIFKINNSFKINASVDIESLVLADFDVFQITRQMWKKIVSSTIYNDIFDMDKSVLYQDMTLPLSSYYMASSHNTYLEGDQLTSASSANRYVSDLLSGCRCVELDCWDGDGGEPVIYHGYTLTSRIFFRDVIDAIAEYGFIKSPYPIVLSIENHCGMDQQARMAYHMKTRFKDILLIPDVDQSIQELPSPEAMR